MPRKPVHPSDDHPIDNVEWVDPETLTANDYNPNRVFEQELELLKLSILEDGWTQPIVVDADGEVIVDGFHRWTLAMFDDEVKDATGGLVPVVRQRRGKTTEDRMAATVRHNRARGVHGILQMGNIVRALLSKASPDDVRRLLGMEREEVARLADTSPSPLKAGRESFGKGWVPVHDKPSKG